MFSRLVALVLVLFATGAVSCTIRDTANHPVFKDGGMLKGAAPLSGPALARLAGVYKVATNDRRFGSDVAVHATRSTLSIFAAANTAYAILHAGCIEGGTRVVLEGAWRYSNSFDTGLVRLFVGPSPVAVALCSAKVPGVLPDKPTLEGLLGTAASDPTESTSFVWDRLLKDGTGKFVVAAHHGACRTIDDCGASENSVASIKMVESFGASVVEIDVRLTRDGVPVLFHDDNLGPRLNEGPFCHGPINEFSLVTLRAACRLKFGEEIPTLDEALAAVVDDTTLSGVWLDTKVPEAVQPTLLTMQKYREIAARKGRKVKIVIGLGEQSILDAYRATTPPPGTLCLVELETSDVERTPCDVWGPRWTRGPMASDVARLQGENKTVVFWTVDEQEFVDLFLTTAKPNGILSDRTGLVLQRFQLVGTLPTERPAL